MQLIDRFACPSLCNRRSMRQKQLQAIMVFRHVGPIARGKHAIAVSLLHLPG
jgi:hypothetical protein